MELDGKINHVLKVTCHDAGLGIVQMTDIDGSLFKLARESENNSINLDTITKMSETLSPLEAYYMGLGVGATIRKEMDQMEKMRCGMPMKASSLAELLESMKG